jgi:Rrf2 family protein
MTMERGLQEVCGLRVHQSHGRDTVVNSNAERTFEEGTGRVAHVLNWRARAVSYPERDRAGAGEARRPATRLLDARPGLNDTSSVLIISTKGDYGMRAAIDLARNYDSGEPVQVKDIAERQDIPKDYLSLIMVDLRKAGVVESVRGPRGGYRLARHPSEISMCEVLETLEGPIQLLDCTSEATTHACSQHSGCNMRNVWSYLTETIANVLRTTTLQQLCSPDLVEIQSRQRKAGDAATPLIA